MDESSDRGHESEHVSVAPVDGFRYDNVMTVLSGTETKLIKQRMIRTFDWLAAAVKESM